MSQQLLFEIRPKTVTLNDYQIGCIFSPDRKYRYVLERVWDNSLPSICFIGLNPSTADEAIDDSTIRKCLHFSKRWGFGRLFMVNLFAFRATQPSEMMAANDPVGEENDKYLQDIPGMANRVVICWGNDGAHRGRDKEVLELLDQHSMILYHLGLNQNGRGTPKHPLYLKNDTELQRYKIEVK